MKIQIQTVNQNILIPIPTSLLLHPLSLKIACRMAQRSDPSGNLKRLFQHIPEQALWELCRELGRIHRQQGSWDLVEVEASDGTSVRISI